MGDGNWTEPNVLECESLEFLRIRLEVFSPFSVVYMFHICDLSCHFFLAPHFTFPIHLSLCYFVPFSSPHFSPLSAPPSLPSFSPSLHSSFKFSGVIFISLLPITCEQHCDTSVL